MEPFWTTEQSTEVTYMRSKGLPVGEGARVRRTTDGKLGTVLGVSRRGGIESDAEGVQLVVRMDDDPPGVVVTSLHPSWYEHVR